MLIPLSSILIILVLFLVPFSSFGQIHKWTDGAAERVSVLYLIGLFIILGMFIKLFREKRDAGVRVRTGPRSSPGLKKRTVLFNVCYKDYSTDSAVVLWKIVERRIRERGENFRDLLYKARKDFGDHVEDPADIFLLAS